MIHMLALVVALTVLGPAIPPEYEPLGQRPGLCQAESGEFAPLNAEGYNDPTTRDASNPELVIFSTYVDGLEMRLVWLFYAADSNTAVSVWLTLPGRDPEQMTFAELTTRYPRACDILKGILKGA